MMIWCIMAGCTDVDYSAEHNLTQAEQKKIVDDIIRYTAKLAPLATHESKFSNRFDAYYAAVADDYDLRLYHRDDQGNEYVLVTRKARSLKPMRESIGIKMQRLRDSVVYYNEAFRTWKMPEGTLEKRFPILFTKMVEGESLEVYYPKSSGDQYIEFPDGRFYFDVQQRRWRDALMDSLQLKSRAGV